MPEGIFSPMHILIILVIVAIFFGAKRLPELGKGLGAGIREFKSGLTDLHSDVTVEEPAPVAEPAPAAEQPKLLAAQATPADAPPLARQPPTPARQPPTPPHLPLRRRRLSNASRLAARG